MQPEIIIVGMGASGQSAAKLALHLGYTVHCVDRKVSSVPMGAYFHLESEGTWQTLQPERVVVSPGVPSQNAVIQQAIAKNTPILSELNFAAQQLTVPIVGVTGTNGKSSTVWYTKQLLEALGHSVFLGGNFGCALSEMVLEIARDQHVYDTAVVEVSSYQMEWSQDFHANAAAILNLTPDHLARHGTIEEYRRCKMKIFAGQTTADRAIVPLTDPTLHPNTDAEVVYFGDQTSVNDRQFGCFLTPTGLHWQMPDNTWSISKDDIPLMGTHNLSNVAVALLLVDQVSTKPVTASLCSVLTPLEHRLEPLWHQGRLWINDSKATNIEATQAALESMTEPVVLLLGGAGKQGANYVDLLPEINRTVHSIICFGGSGQEIQQQLQSDLPKNISCNVTIDLSTAIQLARLEKDHRPILLSPACASFDAFTNFEYRGRFFKDTIQQ